MSKSKDGSARDGRRNNKTPEHSRIKPGQVLNPYGARGKPKTDPPSVMDSLLWEEASRIVSHDSNGPVDAKKRLVQQEFRAALKDNDNAVRARLLAQLHETGERIRRQKDEIHTFFIEGKEHHGRDFYFAEKLGKPAPDILPHPDHVEVWGGQVHFTGPTDARGRAAWEMIKTALRVTACLHEITRNEYRRTGCPAVLEKLKGIEKHRRWLMRKVPKGWNWKEEIYCRDSTLAFAKTLVHDLKEIGYVAAKADD